MKWLVFLLFASIALSANGQTGKKMLFLPTDPEGLTGVPGTRISIRCPEGF